MSDFGCWTFRTISSVPSFSHWAKINSQQSQLLQSKAIFTCRSLHRRKDNLPSLQRWTSTHEIDLFCEIFNTKNQIWKDSSCNVSCEEHSWKYQLLNYHCNRYHYSEHFYHREWDFLTQIQRRNHRNRSLTLGLGWNKPNSCNWLHDRNEVVRTDKWHNKLVFRFPSRQIRSKRQSIRHLIKNQKIQHKKILNKIVSLIQYLFMTISQHKTS